MSAIAVATASPPVPDAEVEDWVLARILEKSPPLLREGIYLAAIPFSFDAPELAHLRQRGDGRDARLAERLALFSFIDRLDEEDTLHYAMHEGERHALQLNWVRHDSLTFLSAHQRASDHLLRENPSEFSQQELLLVYHQLICDPEAGIERLIARFRAYANIRHLATLDQLLTLARGTRPYLDALGRDSAALDDLLLYLDARLAQLRNQWAHSLTLIESLRDRPALAPRLLPYVARAHGFALAQAERYVEAIEEYEFALAHFRQQETSATTPERRAEMRREQGHTMVALGDAYVELAVAARGDRADLASRGRPDALQRLQSLLLPPLPLILYLSTQKLHLWHPRTWQTLHQQDWIIVRLFGTAARWYRQADEVLEAADSPVQWGLSNEKLARLYLTLGASRTASDHFTRLLSGAEGPLSEYATASARLGLASGLLRLGDAAQARDLVQQAVPVLRAYEDVPLQAQADVLLAEIALAQGDSPAALQHMSTALSRYQQLGDGLHTADIAERLDELGRTPGLPTEVAARAAALAGGVTERHYPVRYHHPALHFFSRATRLLLALLVFLLPMLAIQLQPGSAMQLEVGFTARPPLEVNFEAAPLEVEPGFQVAAEPLITPDVAIWAIVAGLLLYLAGYLLFGMLVIARTPLKTVQAETHRKRIRLDADRLVEGQAEAALSLPWAELDRFVTADVALWEKPLASGSSSAAIGPAGRVHIRGDTSRYEVLRDRIATHLPPSARRLNLSYSLLKSPMGMVYVAGWLCLLALVLIAHGPRSLALLNADLAGPYSLMDLYPFLYLVLLVPPLWWGVVRPLLTRAQMGRHQRALRVAAGLGAALTVGGGLLLALIRPIPVLAERLLLPNLYLLVTAIVLLGTSLAALWLVRRNDIATDEGGARAPVAMSILLVALIALSGAALWREMSAYHSASSGTWELARATRLGPRGKPELGEAPAPPQEAAMLSRTSEEEQLEHVTRAIDHFDRALRLSPDYWRAKRGRAAAYTQLGALTATASDPRSEAYETAIVDLSALLTSSDSAGLYTDRAITYFSWSRALELAGQDGRAAEMLGLARFDMDHAIERDPRNPDLRLWRGLIWQQDGAWVAAGNDYAAYLASRPDDPQPHINMGWMHYAQAAYPAALAAFEEAGRRGAAPLEVALARGYALFQMEQFQAAYEMWAEAVTLSESESGEANPVALISRATARWKLGTLGADRCAAPRSFTLEQREEASGHLRAAIDDLSRAIAQEPSHAYTYNTRGRLRYLLRWCPGHTFEEEMTAGLEDYRAAAAAAPEERLYWEMAARFGYSLYIRLRDAGQREDARRYLQEAAVEITEADRLYVRPLGERYDWKETILGHAQWEDNTREGLAAVTQGATAGAAHRYNQALRAVALARLPSSDQGNLFFAATQDIARTVQSDPALPNDLLFSLYEAMAGDLVDFLIRYPDVQADGEFWRAQGEFGFEAGKQLILLEEDEAVEQVVEQIVAHYDRVVEYDPSWQDRLTFMETGALGWFYLYRGNDFFGAVQFYETHATDYERALADYLRATNLISYSEAVSRPFALRAALKAGKAALVMGEGDLAAQLYEQGIARAGADELQELELALAEIDAVVAQHPDLEPQFDPIRAQLQEAISALAN